jgi:hypothetical protein
MFFRSKEEVDASLNVYYETELEKRKQELETKILSYMLEYRIQCAKDKEAHEHEFHYGLEQKKSELARLDAEIDFKNRLTRHYETLLAEKDKTISILKEIILTLNKELPNG